MSNNPAYHVTRAKIRDKKLRDFHERLDRSIYKQQTEWHAHCGCGMKADDSGVQYFWLLCGDELGHYEFCPRDDKGVDDVPYGEAIDGIDAARVDLLRYWLDTPREHRASLDAYPTSTSLAKKLAEQARTMGIDLASGEDRTTFTGVHNGKRKAFDNLSDMLRWIMDPRNDKDNSDA